MHKTFSDRGFSLIELLIVISIMAILGTLGLSAYSTARKQSRDSQRKSDINQYKVALESYYAANASYPLQVTAVSSVSGYGGSIFDDSSQTASPLSNFFGGPPPRGPAQTLPTNGYWYISDSSGIRYKLLADTEIDKCYEACSNGRNGSLASLCANYKTSVSCDL